jgi:hypothetical protein
VGRFLLSAPKGQPGAYTCGLWGGSDLTQEPSDTDLWRLQRAVRALLDTIAARGVFVDLTGDAAINVTLLPITTTAGEVIVSVRGSVRDRYVLVLLMLLRHVGAQRIQPCGVCRRAFFKMGRRKYCGRAACRRAVMRRDWAVHKAAWRPNRLARQRQIAKRRPARRRASKRTR